jgi:sorting nexin-4
MEDPANDYESVRWERPEQEAYEAEEQEYSANSQSTLPQRPKAARQGDSHAGSQADHTADKVDLAGIGNEGFLVCTVEKPAKENEGTKDVYMSYQITTHVCQS